MENMSIKKQISVLLTEWLKSNSTFNVSDFSRKSGVAESSIRRFFSDNKNGSISIENLMKICIALSGDNKLSSLHLHFEEPLKSKITEFTKIFSDKENSNSPKNKFTFNDELNSTLEDFYSYLVYKRISHGDLVTKDDISKWFGDIGVCALENLINKELILNSNDKLEVKHSYFIVSPSLIKSHIGPLINMYYKADTPYNLMSNLSGSVNVDGYGDLIDLFSETREKALNIFETKKGTIPALAIGFVDTMTPQPLFGSTKDGQNE